MAISGNFYLTLSQMQTNVTELYRYIKSRDPDWTEIAIAGMLGNMQTESTINPGIWQNLDEGNLDLGYGLVQWTPATKYLNWCTDNNYVPSNLLTALRRIEYELANGLQWGATSYYEHSFEYFLHDTTLTPYEAAMIFLRNYERPEDLNQPNRGTQAEYWYEFISGELPPGPVFTGKKMPIFLMYRRRFL